MNIVKRFTYLNIVLYYIQELRKGRDSKHKKDTKMTNAITEARSIEQVVEIINASAAGHASEYFGGSDTRDAEIMAGQYAWEAAEESGYTDNDSIEAHLEFLVEAGAEFDFSAALENAISRKKQ